mmetsp:Transcript_5795/g.14060  ORF Transcript_5795/g.14060 Transcript_5795/m.14060 type:complete len:175 (-) Transcript_5795:179-703(-)
MWENASSQSPLQVFDFGLSCVEGTRGASALAGELLGTVNYIAPEVFQSRRYTRACDIWSAGIVAHELLCGDVPFANEAQIKLSPLTFSEPAWKTVSPEAKSLVRWMLERVPRNRPTAEQLLQHPCLRADPPEPTAREDIGRREGTAGGTCSPRVGHGGGSGAGDSRCFSQASAG